MKKVRPINNQGEDIDRISLNFLLSEHTQHMGNFWANEAEGQSRVNIFLTLFTLVMTINLAILSSNAVERNISTFIIILIVLLFLVIYGHMILERLMERNFTSDKIKNNADKTRKFFKYLNEINADSVDPTINGFMKEYRPYKENYDIISENQNKFDLDLNKPRNVDYACDPSYFDLGNKKFGIIFRPKKKKLTRTNYGMILEIINFSGPDKNTNKTNSKSTLWVYRWESRKLMRGGHVQIMIFLNVLTILAWLINLVGLIGELVSDVSIIWFSIPIIILIIIYMCKMLKWRMEKELRMIRSTKNPIITLDELKKVISEDVMLI